MCAFLQNGAQHNKGVGSTLRYLDGESYGDITKKDKYRLLFASSDYAWNVVYSPEGVRPDESKYVQLEAGGPVYCAAKTTAWFKDIYELYPLVDFNYDRVYKENRENVVQFKTPTGKPIYHMGWNKTVQCNPPCAQCD